MRLDVILPTYNRHRLLEKALNSLLAAEVPRGLDVRVSVIDNNSKDNTRQVVEAKFKDFGGRLNYIFEGRQGKSQALNTGIESTNGDLVGMIDDDEEIDRGWYRRIQSAFTENNTDFIGGPYLPRWSVEPPRWLPRDYPAVIGWIDGGDKVQVFGKDYPGMLMGGNAVLTRAILEKVGPYSTALGPVGDRFLAGEDDDMYRRLLAVGAHGLYLPDLIIYHHIPPERLTKSYYRHWCFWCGVSLGLIDRERPQQVVYLAGVPRYLYGRAARGLLGAMKQLLSKDEDPAKSFSNELAVWDLAGFFYGKHIYKSAG
ncbi:MAG: glycosyltransferase family 2 protein [Pyrinomonadaceae bacterium]|nr:glycosyltransferase family 2 protein [Pyrinomonadaceae bacterium]